MKRLILKILALLISALFPINNKKIVFTSFMGRSYSCNPKAISEELYKQCPEFKIVWLFNKESKKHVPNYVKSVKRKSIKAMYELYTAKFWVDNFQKPKWTYKRKDQIYIQTWHGDRSFKKILYDSPNNTDKKAYIENKICDVMVTGSTFGKKMLSSAFNYTGEFLEVGCPRNDILIQNDSMLRKKIKENLNISQNTNVLLFAPTYRRYLLNGEQTISNINLPMIIDKLEKISNRKWICLTRSHSNTNKLVFKEGTSEKMIDVSDYDDMAELLLIADMLITDYSSSAMDFVLRKKPIILFQPDREEYMKKDRTFYIPIEDTPFLVAKSQDELLEIISSLKEREVVQNCEDIMNFYGFYETGDASKRVVDYIIKNVNKVVY